MKKLRFLGSAVMAVFMAFNLASCEKENFTTDTDVTVTPPSITIPGITMPNEYKPGDAVVSIQPTVNALINGNITNVTANATIKIDGEELKYKVLAGQTIAAKEVTITVSYTATIEGFDKVLTAEEKVNVPDLKAGMVAIITPTIWLSVNTKGYFSDKKGQGVSAVESDKASVENVSNYWYSEQTKEITYVRKGAYLVGGIQYTAGYENDQEVIATVNEYVEAYEEALVYETIPVTFNLFAQSQTIIEYSQKKTTTDYEIKKLIEFSRAADENEVTVAKFTIEEYGEFIIEAIKENIHLEGEGHGHGHGNGHGGIGNAGGSIVDPF